LSQPLAPAKLEQALDKAANVIANIVLENATAPATQTTIHKGGYEAVTRLLDRIDHPLSGSLEIGKIRQSIQTLRKDVDLIAEVDRAAEIISIELSKNGDSDQCTSARDQLLL